MLPPLRKLAFRILELGYSYLPSHPIHWDLEYKTLQYSSSKYSWLCFSMSLILNSLISAGAAYDLFVHFFIKSRENYNVGIIGLHVICVAVTGSPVIVFLLMCRHPYTLVGINALLTFEQIQTKTWNINSMMSAGLVDVVMLGMAGLLLPFPFVIFFSSLYFCFDPYYFVLGDILGDPNYENVSVTAYVACLVIRACLTCCAFECGRTITVTAMMIMQLIDILQAKFRDMIGRKIENVKALELILVTFVHLSIIAKGFESAFEESITICITIAFWSVVAVAWVVIKARQLVPFFMYIMSLIAGVLVFVCIMMMLTLFAHFCTRSEHLTLRLKLKSRKMHSKSYAISSRRKLLILKFRSRAFIPIRVNYHPFLVIDGQFCRDTARNLFGRIFDAILIF